MRIFILIFFFLFQNSVNASVKSKIVSNLKLTENLKFNFIQKIGKKIEEGECIVSYPKKIFCKYNDRYNKILVSNGKSLVINSDRSNQYYRYQLDKTPLNLILDKNFLIKKIYKLNERIIDGNLINYTIKEKDYEISIFFDKQNYNLVGWQNVDMYQNFNITFISGIRKNRLISKNLFKIPTRN